MGDTLSERHAFTQNSGSLSSSESTYPKAVLEAMNRPPSLYYRGNTSLLNTRHIIAVVGSRALSVINQQSLTSILGPIIQKDLVIVSGMAIGLDTLAHTIAIDNELPTIAVLGSSVEPEEIYPRSNKMLSEAIIASGGLLLSPFPAGTQIMPYNFPARNSIIAALAPVTLVASAAKNSGALITAKCALDYGRDVMAIPGPIDDILFTGSNRLIQDGAMPILSPNDILSYFDMSTVPPRSYPTSDPDEQVILKILKDHPSTVNELSVASRLSSPNISHVVTKFELQGWITIMPDGSIRLI